MASIEISILVVDDDAICLSVVAGALKKLNHHVVAVSNPLDALSALRMKNNSFDLILTDVHMPEMSGLELLKHVEEEFKLPVVLMSADQNKSTMLKGLQDGAAFYFVKPISSYNLSRLWHFAISATINKTSKQLPLVGNMSPVITSVPNTLRIHDQQGMLHVNNNNNNNNDNNNNGVVQNFAPLSNDPYKENTALVFTNNGLKRPYTEEMGLMRKTVSKKPKLVWTTSLHNKFLEAVNLLGVEKAVPKKILEYMNIPGLKRENVASHLQKYRIFLSRISEATSSMEGGVPNNWNGRPFRSSFVLNEITFLTNNLQQQYQELISHSQGATKDPRTPENGQSSHQVINSFANRNPNQNAPILDQLPRPQSSLQGFSPMFNNDQQGQNSRNEGSLSNHIQSTNNNYVGLRISTNGELVGTNLQNSPIVDDNGANNNLGNDIHGNNHTEKTNAQEANYEFNFANNSNPIQNDAPLVDHFSGIDDWNIYLPSPDHNATPQQNSLGNVGVPQENSLGNVGMPQEMASMQSIGDDQLRQLGIDIQVDQETFGNDFGFGCFDAPESLFEGLDQGITSNDDISFDCYFAEENGQEFNPQDVGVDFSKPN